MKVMKIFKGVTFFLIIGLLSAVIYSCVSSNNENSSAEIEETNSVEVVFRKEGLCTKKASLDDG